MADETTTKPSRVTNVAEFLQKCREEYAEDARRDRIDREEGQEDNDFANSPDKSKGQWSDKARKAREDAGRPVLQFNRIPTYLQHIANAGRQNKPSIKITAGDKGTPETAEMLEARIRFIEYDSDASTVYDTARDQQVASGRGFIRVLTEEIEGGKQVARLARIENQFSVIFGPHRKYDASDADRCWVTTRISKAEHRRRFGKESLLNREDFAPFTGDEDWNNLGPEGEMVQIAEYFVKEYDDEGNCTVCCYVINGREILEEGEFIVDDIPIVPQWGREALVDGVMRHFSLHNPGKDWQRLINLYGSNIAEMIAAAPKDRFEAPVGSIPKHLEDSYSSNSPKNIRYYNQYDPDNAGRPLNKPEVAHHEPAIEAASMGLQQAIEGLKASMGIYDASMGQRSNETSGIAINRRKVEGEVTNYHFPGNEERTRKRVGQILIKIISLLDKPGSTVPIRRENGKTEMVPIGKEYEHPRTKKPIVHVLTDADYAVEVESGPSYPNAMEQKQEAEQALVTAAPELLFTEVGVNMLRNSGRPGADEDADALERYINFKSPGLIPNKDEQPIPPQIAQQMQMMQQKLQTTEKFAQSLHEQIQTKQVEQQGKVALQQSADATKLEIAKMQEETKRVLGLAKIQSDEALAKLEAELGIVHKKVDSATAAQSQASEHAHADASQATDLAASAASQGAQQAHEATQAEASREAEPVGAEA